MILYRIQYTSNYQVKAREINDSEKKKTKMIYRKWSLLTGPVAILGGIVGTVVVANFVFFDNVNFY